MTKEQIIISILFDLLAKDTVKANYLAKKYDISLRSVYRYIETLEQANVPIYSNRGREGGFCILDGYHLHDSFMTADELDQTIKALSSITDNVPNKDLSQVITKLTAMARAKNTSFDVGTDNLLIASGSWGNSAGYRQKLEILQKSIENNQKISIRYHDNNGEVTERIIEPYIIIFKQGLWYVYAYCEMRKGFRTFRTGRIERATPLRENFIRQTISKEQVLKELDDYIKDKTTAEQIDMEIDSAIISDIEEWLGVENIEKQKENFFASVSLPYDGGLISKIMSYGNKIKIIKPQKLKDAIRENAKQLLSVYK